MTALRLSSLSVLLAASAVGISGLITGCGAGTAATSAGTASFQGIVHGGPNPIVGATVNLYSTGTTGYGAGATLLATTTTDSTGAFQFPPNTCTANSEVYATAAGGNTGANSANNNSLLLAALGDCANISSSTMIWISEPTTVAAGYALSHFMTVTGSGSTATVNIGGPASNAAATGTCTGTGASMSCTGAGLRHAFQNALNLASSVTNASTSANPTGQFYATPPSASATYAHNPLQLMNLLANVLQACVNSTGGTAGDTSTPCGNLFANTTPPSSLASSPVTPTNTLQAVQNLAMYPTMTAAQVTAVFGVATGTSSFYQPALSTAPKDYSLGVVYKSTLVGTTDTPMLYTFYSTLDVNDNLYTAEQPTSSGGPTQIVSLSSNGAGRFVGASISATNCAAASPCILGVDTNNNIWVPATKSSVSNVYQVNASTGALTSTFAVGTTTGSNGANGAAVDRYGNVYVTITNGTTDNLWVGTPGGGTYTFASATAAGNPVGIANGSPEYLSFDNSGNLWIADYTVAANGNAYGTFLGNSGSSSTVFASAPVGITLSNADTQTYGVVFDSAGNAWYNTIVRLYKVSPSTQAVLASYPITDGTNSAASARFSAIDGDGNIALPENSTGDKVFFFYGGTTGVAMLSPCGSAAATGTACATGNAQPVYSPRNSVIDATGSIWTTNSPADGVSQIIGTAAPTWGQLSYAKQGVRP